MHSYSLEFASIQVLSIDSTSNHVLFLVDGTVHGRRTRETKPGIFEEFTIGARQIDTAGSSPGAQSFFPVSVAELIVYSAALSEVELQKVEDYLAKKHT